MKAEGIRNVRRMVKEGDGKGRGPFRGKLS